MKLENPGAGRDAARQRVAAGLTRAVLGAERRLGRGVDRTELARRVNVSPASLYAYLNGTTLPRGAVFERLLDELGVNGAERGQLTTLRDAAEVAHRVGSDRRGERARPRQLPADTRHFVSRDGEVARLVGIASAPDGDAARICVVEGVAGVGKSALATRLAHRVKHLFPDGQVYADLHGFAATPPLDAAEVLLSFLHALGATPGAIPPTQSARTALYRTLLDGKRVLVLLDNAASSDQVRPLVPAAPGCLLVVTSRNRMDSLVAREGATRIPLAVLAPRDATDLLAARIGAERVDAEPAAVSHLVDLCGGLPLALSVIASRAADRPGEPLSALVAELRDADDRLDPLSSPDPDVDLRTVFRWSYDALSRPAARLFRLLGVHPGPDIGIAACAALAGTREPPRAALRELLAANMLAERSRGRFHLHDLLRTYAAERASRDDPESERAAASRRILDHYLHAASSADARIQPVDAEEHGDASPAPDTYSRAMAWFTAEHEVLLALVGLAADGFESHAWRLARACTVFLRRSGRHAARVEVQRLAVSAARRAGDRTALATSRRMLADALARSGQDAEVWSLLADALAAFEELGDDRGALRTHLSFVRALDLKGDHTTALEHAEAALRLASDRPELADALAATARQLAHLGRTTTALDRCARALELYSAVGNPEGEASVLKVVGDVELGRGHLDRAITAYERSLALDRALGDRYWEAHALHRMATAHHRLGDPRTAGRLRDEAVDVLRSLHHPDAGSLPG